MFSKAQVKTIKTFLGTKKGAQFIDILVNSELLSAAPDKGEALNFKEGRRSIALDLLKISRMSDKDVNELFKGQEEVKDEG